METIKQKQLEEKDKPLKPSYILLSNITLRRLKEDWAILHPDRPFSLAGMVEAIRGE